MTQSKAIAVGIVLTVFLQGMAFSQTDRVSWYSFGMGFGEPKQSNTAVKSVIGQSLLGTSRQENTQVISGFLADTLFRGTIVSVENSESLPESYALWQNYPNPFNPSTTIRFELSKKSHVTLRVYDMLGREVLNLVDEHKGSGTHEVRVEASMLPSGVYFYRLRADKFVSTKRFILVR